MIAGWCSACGSPAHVEFYGVLYCYECGRKAVAAKRSGASGSPSVPAAVRDNTAEGGAPGANGEGK